MPPSQLPPVHRYLWAQGANASPLPSGSYLAERYRVVRYPLLQDTQPQTPPPPLEEVPPLAAPYLALSPFSIAIPRPFTQVAHPQDGAPLLLLEEVPLRSPSGGQVEPTLLPTLAATWPQAGPLHQLSWLWRLAKLWQPCQDYQVAHCLLDEQQVRVDGEDIRLLTLQASESAPTLVDLGKHWRHLMVTAAAPIRDYLAQLTDQLIAGQGHSRGLVHSLVQAIEQQSVQQSIQVQLATYSDQGPMRNRNEDACFPPSDTVHTVLLPAATGQRHPPAPLVVVCDGVGGHQGGDVASQSAIAEVTRQLSPLLDRDRASHREVVTALRQAILTANQVISERNDADQRQARNRMGTTIVMALVYGGRLYVGHLGDSRAYRVRTHSFRQLTLDDDVAAREMRLGLGLYQDALQHPGSGALVQALGMANAGHLHPTIKLFPIADDSLILLCSDGLSDHDLLERLWSTELLPTLWGDRDVGGTAMRLITLANEYNGHDNVTVGLLRLSPRPAATMAPVPAQVADYLLADVGDAATGSPLPSMPATAATMTTQLPSPPRRRGQGLPLAVASILVAGMVGIGGAIGWQWWQQQSVATGSADPAEPNGEILSPSATPPSTRNSSLDNLSVGDYLQIRQLPDPTAAATVITTTSPPVPSPADAVDLPKRLLSVGSVVQISSRQQTPDGQLWVRLQVCSAASPPPSASVTSTVNPAVSENPAATENSAGNPSLPLASPGDHGWLPQTDISIFAERLLDTSSTQQGLCID
ncbi:MAG: protein phosphatase 2C domain-containing protein [Cyanobacteria bacterium P01_H01_bin.153]